MDNQKFNPVTNTNEDGFIEADRIWLENSIEQKTRFKKPEKDLEPEQRLEYWIPLGIINTEAYRHYCRLFSQLSPYLREKFFYQMLCDGIHTLGLDERKQTSVSRF